MHRSLGVHVSKVRSCNLVSWRAGHRSAACRSAAGLRRYRAKASVATLRLLPATRPLWCPTHRLHLSHLPPLVQDTWLPEQVAFVSAMGNARAAVYWEANLPPDFRRPPENDMSLLRTFITDK